MRVRTKTILALSIGYLIVLPICVYVSYLMATIGHPSSVWLWRDILGFTL